MSTNRKNHLLVDISIAVEPHLLSLSKSCAIMVDAGRRMREAIKKGDLFVAGMAADELAAESDAFKVSKQSLMDAAYKVYAMYGNLDTAEGAVQDAMSWAHAAAMRAGKPVGQA